MCPQNFRAMPCVRRAAPILTAIALLFGVANASAQTRAPDNLRTAVEMALSTSPDVSFALGNLKAALKERDAADGRFLPQIDLQVSVGHEDKLDPAYSLSANNRVSFDRTLATLSLRQMLYDGGVAASDRQRMGYTAKAKYFELKQKSHEVALATIRAYIDLLRYRALVSLAEDNYVAHKVIYEQLKLKAASGVGRQSDVDQAQSRMSLAEYNLTVEGANLHDIEARFLRQTGLLPPRDIDSELMVQVGIPKSIQEALTLSQTRNPGLVAAWMDAKAQAELIKSRSGATRPQIDLRARRELGIDLNGYSGRSSNDVVEVVMNWNLYNGGADVNLQDKEVSLLAAADARRELTCKNQRLELEIAYHDVQKLLDQLAFLDTRQIAIERARDAYRAQFEIDKRSLVDLLNSENEVFEAKRLFINLDSDLMYAYARTHYQLGTLLKTLNLELINDPVESDSELAESSGLLGAGATGVAAGCPIETPKPYAIDRKDLDDRAGLLLKPAGAR